VRETEPEVNNTKGEYRSSAEDVGTQGYLRALAYEEFRNVWPEKWRICNKVAIISSMH